MRTVWLLGGGVLVLFIGMGVWLAPLEPSVVALQFAYTPARFHGVLAQWGDTGARLYRLHLWPDALMMLGYAAFGYLYAVRAPVLVQLPNERRRGLAWLLPFAAVCDAAENAVHWGLIDQRIQSLPEWVMAAAAFAAGKWLLLLAFALTVGLAGLQRRR